HQEQTERQRDTQRQIRRKDFQTKARVLTDLMKRAARGKPVQKMPGAISRLVSLKALRKAVQEWKGEVSNGPSKLHKDANWQEVAVRLLSSENKYGLLVLDDDATPWEIAIPML